MSSPSFRRNSRAKAERLAAAGQLIDQGAVVCVYWSPFNPLARRPGKSPIPYSAIDPESDDGSRNECRAIDEVERFLDFDPMANLAVLGVAQVDADDQRAIELASSLGVSSADQCWIIRTRRGWRAIYAWPPDEPSNVVKLRCTCGTKRNDGSIVTLAECRGFHIDDEGVALDLLSHSPALLPPSIHPSGVPYRWSPGHTPGDIPLSSLGRPPVELTTFWRSFSHKPATPRQMGPHQGRDVQEAIESALEACRSSGDRGLPRPGSSGWIPTNCPLHEDANASFSYLPPTARDPGAWICHAGCGSGSLRLLAERLGLQVTTVRRAGRGGFTTETRF